ncbi:hypothetical protein AOLI_G00091060 [Acnodon oligacanthus]
MSSLLPPRSAAQRGTRCSLPALSAVELLLAVEQEDGGMEGWRTRSEVGHTPGEMMMVTTMTKMLLDLGGKLKEFRDTDRRGRTGQRAQAPADWDNTSYSPAMTPVTQPSYGFFI